MQIQTRRQFLTYAGIGTMSLLLSNVEPFKQIVAASPGMYKGATYITPAYRAVRQGVLGFVDQLKRQAPAGMGVDFFDSASLMRADEQLPALYKRTIQFMLHTTTYISKEFPILGITGLPGVSNHLYEHGERIAMESRLWKLINDQLAQRNLFMLTTGGGVFEPEYIWSNKGSMIASLTDLEGKRCRIVGHEAEEILKSFGVKGVRISSAKTYLALQRGSVDGVVANISTVIARNLYEHFDYCFQIPVTSFSLGIFLCKDVWEQMSSEERDAFWQAGQWYDRNQAYNVNHKFYPNEYWPVITNAGIRIIQPTEEEKMTFANRAEPIWNWWRSLVGQEAGKQAVDLAVGAA